MYEAIVFLPLLGSIIAGIIALVGARSRYPGAEPAPPHDDHAAPLVPEDHERGAPVAATEHAEIDHPSLEKEEIAEPAAGSQAAELITTTLLGISWVLSGIAFLDAGLQGHESRVQIFNFITSGNLKVDWALRIDPLTAVMMFVVTTVSALVHLYSIGYMADDPYKPRFFSYLSFFTFAMLMLATADNLAQLFVGWEGVGLASYLLIGFWYHKPEANAAAIKAFIVNRVGDFGFALGIFAIFFLTGSINFDAVFAQAPDLVGRHFQYLSFLHADALTVVCFLLFMGAMGKSAQFLLHTWLPDAMEGPTPVSALIHAATMVTAGVFMVARLSPLFSLAPGVEGFVTFIGATTAFFAASVALVQNDIKRVIAYSTCSQLGYMFVGMGVGAYSLGMFHLFTHAFFKALLFLCSGSVIIAMHHEQDMRRMGGLWRKLPFTYATMVVGTLALSGFPFTSGYYSKDAIIEAAAVSANPMAAYGFIMTVAAAALTSFYSWRLIFKTFHGEPHDRLHYEAAHETAMVMLIPLAFLAGGALVAGWAALDVFRHGAAEFFRDSLNLAAESKMLGQMEHLPLLTSISPTLAMIGGFLVAWLFYIGRPDVPEVLAREQGMLYRFLLNAWYFDRIYDVIFVRPTMAIGRLLWKGGDGFIIDGLGPDGVSARVLDVTRNVIRLQTGYLYHYAFAMLIGAAGFVTWFMFAGAH